MDLRPAEVRVLGCLMEKQRTTPDAYPLSLNALRLACNQSTNRDPVVSYDEDVVRDATTRLQRRGLARLASGAGSRAAKFRHLLAERLPLDDGEHAVMCVLMLRGAQTPGELKQRTERMHAFADLAAVQETLDRLIERELVQRLARQPGQKEERYEHLLAEDTEEAPPADAPAARTPAPEVVGASSAHAPAGGPTGVSPAQAAGAEPSGAPAAAIRPGAPGELAELRARVERLEREVADLREALGG